MSGKYLFKITGTICCFALTGCLLLSGCGSEEKSENAASSGNSYSTSSQTQNEAGIFSEAPGSSGKSEKDSSKKSNRSNKSGRSNKSDKGSSSGTKRSNRSGKKGSSANKKTGSEKTDDNKSSVKKAGWTVEDLKEVSLPDDASDALSECKKSYKKISSYIPVVLIGRQTVSGTNYSVLCCVHDGKSGNNSLRILTIYQKLNGKVKILNDAPFPLKKVMKNHSSAAEDTDGAFETNTEYSSQTLMTDDIVVMGHALSKKKDATYRVAGLLGRSDGRLAFLALRTVNSGKKNETAEWTVLNIKKTGEETSEVTSVYEIDPGDYIK